MTKILEQYIKLARKKPVTIEYVEWTGDNSSQIRKFCPKFERTVAEDVIQTLEGAMKVSIGDFVIKGVEGEFYPCKPDIFHKTYDLLD